MLGRGSTQAKGSRNITSAYVEFSIPALKSLELQLAGRTDRYSDFGSSSTPKVGIRWNVDPTLLMRATFAKGFRAPSIPESGEASAFFFQTLSDTTRCNINPVYCGGVSVPGSFSANPELKPEKSDSYTAGLVWEPARGASLGLDYYYVKQKDLVSNRSFQFILNNEALYSQYVTRGPQSAEDIARGAPGPLVLVAVPFENLSLVETKGVDIDARVRLPMPGGALTTGLTGSYVISYKQPNAPGEPLTEFAGTYELPRFKGIASLNWDQGPFSTNVAVNYVHKFKQDDSASPNADPFIKAWTTVDLQASWMGLRNTKLTIGAKNLFDKEPPIAVNETLLYVFQQHSLRGRFVYASVNYKFR